MQAQDILADYLEAATTTTTLLNKSTTRSGKLRHHYEAKLAGTNAELIVGTSNDVNFPIMVTAFFKFPRKTVTTPLSSPCPSEDDGWTTVAPKIKKYF
uniref:Helitron helicase n=1 Tax=Panagrellus redivivus TaxID=6233 RepID=A0A7E4UP92_PANRE